MTATETTTTYIIVNARIEDIGNDGERVDTRGYRVDDYFSAPVLSRGFASRTDATKAANDSYLGVDADGVGVSWEIAEA